MSAEITKITAAASKRSSKFNSIIVLVLVVCLSVLSIVNQQYFIYDSILLKFLVTGFTVALNLYLLLRKTEYGLRFSAYWCSAVVELKKVTWPNKKETMQTAAAVVVMVIIMGLLLWTVDSVLIRLVAWLLKKGGI